MNIKNKLSVYIEKMQNKKASKRKLAPYIEEIHILFSEKQSQESIRNYLKETHNLFVSQQAIGKFIKKNFSPMSIKVEAVKEEILIPEIILSDTDEIPANKEVAKFRSGMRLVEKIRKQKEEEENKV